MTTMEQNLVENGQGIRRISPGVFTALQKIARLLDANERQRARLLQSEPHFAREHSTMIEAAESAVWRNSYYVASGPSEAGKKRAVRKIPVCGCHLVPSVTGKLAHPIMEAIADRFAKAEEFLVKDNHQRLYHFRVLVRLHAQFRKFLFGHVIPSTNPAAALAEAQDAVIPPGEGLWK